MWGWWMNVMELALILYAVYRGTDFYRSLKPHRRLTVWHWVWCKHEHPRISPVAVGYFVATGLILFHAGLGTVDKEFEFNLISCIATFCAIGIGIHASNYSKYRLVDVLNRYRDELNQNRDYPFITGIVTTPLYSDDHWVELRIQAIIIPSFEQTTVGDRIVELEKEIPLVCS